MKIIDAVGMKCPQPLVLAKKALKEAGENETFEFITDCVTSRDNLKKFLADNNIKFKLSSAEDSHSFLIYR